MTLLPGSLATVPPPTRGVPSSNSATRSEGSRDFASALQGALDGADAGHAGADIDVTVAQPQVDAPAAEPVPAGLAVPTALPVQAGLTIPTGQAVQSGLAIPAQEAGIDASAAAGLATGSAAESAVAPALGGTPHLTAELIGSAAAAVPVPGDGTAQPTGGTAATVTAVSSGAAAWTAVPQQAANAQAQNQNQQAENQLVPGQLAAPVGATAAGVAALVPAAASSPAAQLTTVPLTTVPLTTATESPVSAALSSVPADTGEQSSDTSRNGAGQPAPGALSAATVPAGIAAPATAFAAATATVAASQGAQADAPSQAPLSTQIARPLFSLANAAHGEHVMTISITPDNLGPVTVRAHVGGEGIRVELFAPNDAGRDALRSILPELKRDLAGSGMTGASLDLSSRNQAESSRDQGQQPGGSGRDRASASAGDGAVTGAPSPERTTVPTWYGPAASIDVMA